MSKRRPSLDDLFARAMDAAAKAKSRAPGAGVELLAADDALRARCRRTKDGSHRGMGGHRALAIRESIKRDPETAAEFAQYLEDEVLVPEVKDRCAEDEGLATAEQRKARDFLKLARGAVRLEEASYRGRAAIEKRAAGKDVILFHGTTTKLIPKILKRGLVIGEAKVDPNETPGVYLSARHSSGGGFAHALGYARRAAGRLGGEPVVLTVRVPFDSLSWDADDEDIASGNYQFVTDEVPLSSIIAVDDEPVRGR